MHVATVGSVRQLAGRVVGTGKSFAGKYLGNRPLAPRGRCEIGTFKESFGCGKLIVLARTRVWWRGSVLVVLSARILLS